MEKPKHISPFSIIFHLLFVFLVRIKPNNTTMPSEEGKNLRLGEGDNSCRPTDEINERRRTGITQAFTERFEKGDLSMAVRGTRIPEPELLVRVCDDYARELMPVVDDERRIKMAFIVAYTLDSTDWKGEEKPYRVLNNAIIKGDSFEIGIVRCFLYGLLEGLRSLPYMQFPKLYRGIDVEVNWTGEDIRVFGTFTSMTRCEEVGRRFLKNEGGGKRSGTLIRGEGLHGYDVCGYSTYWDEMEVILEPFQQVHVCDVKKAEGVVTVDVIDGGGTKPILLKRIPQSFVMESPESEMIEEGLDHCRKARVLEMEEDEKGAEKEWSEGMEWFLKAAKGQSQIGALNVGVGYLFGIGVERDFVKGIEWLKKGGKVEEEKVWMVRELSNREYFMREGVDMSSLFFLS